MIYLNPVYLDPGIKRFDKTLYNDLQEQVKNFNLKHVDKLDRDQTPSLLLIGESFKLNILRNYEDKDNFSNSLIVIFQEEKSNLSLFENATTQVLENEINLQNINDFKQLTPFIEKHLYFQEQAKLEHIRKKVLIDTKEISQGSKRLMERLDYDLDNINKLRILFDEIYQLILSQIESKRRDPLKDVVSFLNKKIQNAKFEFLKDISSYQNFDKIIKLNSIENDEYYLGVVLKKRVFSLEDSDYFIIGLLVSIFELYNSSLQSFVFSDEKNEVISGVFNLIPTPCVLFTQSGDLLLYNDSFVNLQLSPGECLKLEHKSTLKFGEERYLCHKSKISNGSGDFYLYFFTGKEDELNKQGQSIINPKELGIITSSIAHELNNPLAGILTAISYLRMDDYYTPDQIKGLEEMEASALRCKKLVEVFLGFSKAHSLEGFRKPLKESYENALSLLNFRVVETNIKLNLNWNVSDYFNEKFLVNSSVFSMVFYILLGDLITAFSHSQLLKERPGTNQLNLNGSIFDKYESIIFDMEGNISNYLKDLEFVSFLLRLEGHFLEVSDNQLKIKFNLQSE